MIRIGGFVSAMAAIVLMAGSPASGQLIEFTIPIDTLVEEPPGSTTLLATFDVPAEQQGPACTIEAINQQSVHPGNDLVVESGGATAVLEDVEAAPNAVTRSPDALVLGPTISVSLRMGPDGKFSGGILITVGCPSEATTTTAATTSTVATTTSAPTTTPATAPATSPTTAPATAPTTTPATAPATSPTTTPATAPATSPSPTTAPAPSSSTPPTVAASTIAQTGGDVSGPGFFGGLALVVAGAFLLVLVEIGRHTKRTPPRR